MLNLGNFGKVTIMTKGYAEVFFNNNPLVKVNRYWIRPDHVTAVFYYNYNVIIRTLDGNRFEIRCNSEKDVDKIINDIFN